MARLSSYATVTALLEAMFLYTAIDTDSDGSYESRKVTLASLRAALNATNGTIHKLSKGADVASATALSLGTDGNSFDITGTATITSITTKQVGTVVVLQFDGILTLTHHATDLILPGGVNITTAAGDIAIFYEYATGDWRCISYQRASSMPTLDPAAGMLRPVYLDAAPQALSGPGAVNITSPVTNVTTTGATDALTLVDATVLGLMKVINHEVDGGGYVLTPTTLSGGTTITVTAAGVSITLMWTASGWRLVSQTGVATIA